MRPIKEIEIWDMPDTKSIPDGYDREDVPDISAANIKVLKDKINEIIETLNQMLPS